MRIENLRVTDVILEDSFFDGYKNAPEQIRIKMLDIIERLSDGQVPNSLRAKKLEGSGLWRGWVGTGRMAWRVLFQVDWDKKIIILKYLDSHEIMEKRWKVAGKQ